MLSEQILAIPSRGALNMHGSLLPKYRGRAPVNWAVLHGERETGASLHYMAAKPDAGDLVAQMAVPILPDDTAREVFDKVTVAAECTLDRVMPASSREPRRARRSTSRAARTSAAASRKTGASTGRRTRPASTTSCARSRRPTLERSRTWPDIACACCARGCSTLPAPRNRPCSSSTAPPASRTAAVAERCSSEVEVDGRRASAREIASMLGARDVPL